MALYCRLAATHLNENLNDDLELNGTRPQIFDINYSVPHSPHFAPTTNHTENVTETDIELRRGYFGV